MASDNPEVVSDRCPHHEWPDDGKHGGERCIRSPGHPGDHEFGIMSEKRFREAGLDYRGQPIDHEPRPLRGVDQTVFGRPLGNCFAACLATVLRVELGDVPWPTEGDADDWVNYWPRVHRYLAFRGARYVEMDLAEPILPDRRFAYEDPERPGPVWVMAGLSPRDEGETPDKPLTHSVLYRDGELLHDPHPSRDGILDIRTAGLVVRTWVTL